MTITENDSNVKGVAITGTATGESSIGVLGKGKAVGVRGDGETWHGVVGFSKSTTGGVGVYGKNTAGGAGVFGDSDNWMGVYGKSTSTTGGAGVNGEGDECVGVLGASKTRMGVYGYTDTGVAGVWGEHRGKGVGVGAKSKDGQGLRAYSESNEAVYAETHSPGTAAVAALNLNPEGKGAAIFAKKVGSNGHAGYFEGNVHVTGNLVADGDIVLTNADCAEDFDIVDSGLVEPGTVMVVGEEGALHPSNRAYDKRVAGVISGAGNYKPGIVLDKQHSQPNRKPIALLGKVYCKVDASQAPIEVGDLLTTAPTPGHAMKATDPLSAFGAVIGKALRPWREGQGLIPILIALQ
jgi:hypothetical protein